MKSASSTRAPVQAEDRLLNRELSLLEWNARVLELAADPAIPLLERVFYCGICASNLDEFFMVRVAGLTEQAEVGMAVRSPDGRTPTEALSEIRLRVAGLISRSGDIWADELQPALAAQGITIGGVGDCNERELAELTTRFEREVYPVLTPLAVGAGLNFPFISPLSLSLGVFVRDPDTNEERFARVKVPERLPRFLPIGRRGLMVPLEDVIAHFLAWLFPGMELVESALFRVTRDSDLTVSDEADDLLEAVEVELRRRRFGDPVRLEVSHTISPSMLERLQEGLGVADEQVYAIAGLLDLGEVMQICALERPELKFEPWQPVTQPRLSARTGGRDLFGELRRGDILVHLPYDAFSTSVGAFVRGASDPDIVGFKTCVYRTSGDSPLVPALIEAAEEGKQSVCLVELKARFDESRNIAWSRALEQAGVHVVYGFPNRKIHAKITLLIRREGRELRRYAHIGTGNYNARTARSYEDLGLFTADEEITADLADLFNYLTGFGKPQRFRKLLVAPFDVRSGLIKQIRAVADAAAAGKAARIRIKANSLIDVAIIDELYRASSAGARIDIVTRSICALRPGVPGLSENIRVRSVLGPFLEHSRFSIFNAGPSVTCYMGSADLMPRNLDHRIEVLAPVEDVKARDELVAVFDALLADNRFAWELDAAGSWRRVTPKKDDRDRGAQMVLMRRARTRARRWAAARSRKR